MTRSLYRSLLWLYPPDFRQRFGGEMLWIYDETAGAGAIPLFADGMVSLVRQWGTRSAPLAVAWLGGALHMALFLVMFTPMMQTGDRTVVRRLAMVNGPADTSLDRFGGSWIGSLRSTGPSGPIELILTKKGAEWMGKFYIQGSDGEMHGGPLEDIQVEANRLRFRVQAGDADMTFTGELREGRLAGVLEAMANGRHTASAPKGKKVGEGIWLMAPATPRGAAIGNGIEI